MRDAFGEAPAADEDERRLVGFDQRRQTVVDLVPHLVGRDGAQLIARDLNGEVHLAAVADVDDAGLVAEEASHLLYGFDGGGEADALGAGASVAGHQRVEAGEREGEMRAALVVGDSVDLIDDHRSGGGESLAALLGGHEDEERLGCGHQHVRRLGEHLLALPLGGVAGTDGGADGGERLAAGVGEVAEFVERAFEVLADVVAEGLERGDVEGVDTVVELGRADERVEGDQEGRERLAGAGGGGDEHVAAGADLGPAADLRFCRLAEPGGEPLGDERMESGQRHSRLGGALFLV